MAKARDIKDSEALEAYRRGLYYAAKALGFLAAFVFASLYAVYVFLAIAQRGYGGTAPFPWAANLGVTLPYFSTQYGVFALQHPSVLARWGVHLLAVLIVIGIYVGVSRLLLKAFQAQANRVSFDALLRTVYASYGIRIAKRRKAEGVSKAVFQTMGLSHAHLKNSEKDVYAMSNDRVSFDMGDFHFLDHEDFGNCLLLVATLSKPKIQGLFQLSTIPFQPLRDYRGRPVMERKLDQVEWRKKFKAYSTLDFEEFHAFASPELLNRAMTLRQLAGNGFIVTYRDETLSLMLEGLSLRIGRPLKERLPGNFLETQALAVDVLFETFQGLARAGSLEGNANPLVGAYGQEEPLR